MKEKKIVVKISQGIPKITTHDIPASQQTIVGQNLKELRDALGGKGKISRQSRADRHADHPGDSEDEDPRLDFFQNIPANAKNHPPLISSFQSLETCFCLIGLERHPHALISCASAIESAIKAKLKISQKNRIKFGPLVELISSQHGILSFSMNNPGLNNFREARDAFVHFGFIPRDDEKSVDLLLRVGLPYLARCYRELFAFHLDYRDIPPAGRRFDELSAEEYSLVGLPERTADQMRVAFEVYGEAKKYPRIPVKYCLSTFGQYISFVVRSFYKFSDAEHPDSFFGDFSSEIDQEKMEQAVQSIWQVSLSECITFNCPICNGRQTLVARNEERRVKIGEVSLQEVICVKCGLSIPKGRPFLADIFLHDQIKQRKEDILQTEAEPERPIL